ncbi:MAG: beta-propeller domain-containing protein [Woeseiaceae bacterium]|nr:beta-propeller domain-containing protein [Woeseiaceae bacterium]
MTRIISLVCGLSFLVLAGCGSSSEPGGGNPEPPVQGLLSAVSDLASFEASLKNGLTQIATTEQLAAADAAATAAAAGNFTGTYTQELNVDELDAVRYDGEHLFVAPRRYFHCCFILEDSGAPAVTPPPEPERSIRILSTNPAAADAELAGTIPLEDGVSVQGMYVEDDTLFAVTGTMMYGTYGGLWGDVSIWAPEKMGFRIYDVSDASNPTLDADVTIDGVFVDSRRIGNTVYLVSRYTPWIEGLHYYVSNAAQQAENQALLANTSLDDLLPKITIDGQTRTLVAPERCYVTTNEDAPYAVITSIVAIPLDDPDNFRTTCYNEDTYGVYVSENALYFTQHRLDTASSTDMTRIHKFALAGTDARYRGSADVKGFVWRGGQEDFRMNEHNGDLRLIATHWDRTNDDFVDHQLYILRESNARPDLEIVSTLPNDNRPEEIGKPNEALYGVRFLGDVAYAVTFEQIDPLYAIDLSNPADPFIAGELEVTGFSDFLHPVTDDLLLGLGRSAEGGIKIELFDVSNIAQPLSRGSAVIGGRASHSEANYDRHAFTYQADVDGTDRFTIPANVYAVDGDWRYLGAALYLFEILDKDMPALTSLNRIGAIEPPPLDPNAPDWVGRSRAFIHDDTVYYVRDEDVWAAFWATPTIVNGPY